MSPQNNNADDLIQEFGLSPQNGESIAKQVPQNGAPVAQQSPQSPAQSPPPQGALQAAQPQVQLISNPISNVQQVPVSAPKMAVPGQIPNIQNQKTDEISNLMNEFGLKPSSVQSNESENNQPLPDRNQEFSGMAKLAESLIPGMQVVAPAIKGISTAVEKYFPKAYQDFTQSSLMRADRGTLQSVVNDNIVNPLNLIPGVNLDPMALSDGSKAAIAGQVLGHIGSFMGAGKFASFLKAPELISALAKGAEDIPVASSITRMMANPIGMRALGNGIYGAIQSPGQRLVGAALMTAASPLADLGAYGVGKGFQVVKSIGKGIKAAITKDPDEALLNYVKNKLFPGEELTPKDLTVAQQNAKTAQEAGISGIPAGALTQSPAIQAKEATLNVPTISNAYNDVKNQLHSAIQDSINKLGGQDTAKEILGQNINNVSQDAINSSRKNISNLYNNAANAPGGDVVLNSKPIIDAYDNLRGSFSSDNPFSKNIQSKIESLRPPRFGEVKMNPPSVLTVKNANDLIKTINEQWPGYSPESATLRRALGSLKKTIYDSIDNIGGDETNPSAKLYQIARDARHALGDELEPTGKVPGKTLVKAISRGEIPPEKLLNQAFKSTDNVTELNNLERALKFSIDENGNKVTNPEGEKAWDDLRTSKLSQMLNNSTDFVKDNNGNDIPTLNYSKFLKEYNKVGSLGMSKIISNPEISQNLNKIMEVAKNVNTKQPGVINTSNTAKSMVQYGKNLVDKLARAKGLGHIIGLVKTLGDHFSDDDWVTRNLNLNEAFKKYPDLADQVKAIPGNVKDEAVVRHIVNLAKGTLMGNTLYRIHNW